VDSATEDSIESHGSSFVGRSNDSELKTNQARMKPFRLWIHRAAHKLTREMLTTRMRHAWRSQTTGTL